MNSELNKVDTNLTKEQLKNVKKVTEKFEKIIEKHLGKNFPVDFKAILLISYIFSKGNSEDEFEKQVILLKELINNGELNE